MMGIFNKKINNIAAVTGMLVGLGSTLIYIFIYKGWFFFPGTNNLPDNAANWVLGIQPESFGAVGALLNFITAILVSKVTAPTPEHIQHLVEDIRVPKGAGGAVDH
jgi:cation/acetate symporter